MFDNGEAGVRFWRACINSRVAMVVFYVDNLYGNFPYCGENSTVSATHSCAVRFS